MLRLLWNGTVMCCSGTGSGRVLATSLEVDDEAAEENPFDNHPLTISLSVLLLSLVHSVLSLPRGSLTERFFFIVLPPNLTLQLHFLSLRVSLFNLSNSKFILLPRIILLTLSSRNCAFLHHPFLGCAFSSSSFHLFIILLFSSRFLLFWLCLFLLSLFYCFPWLAFSASSSSSSSSGIIYARKAEFEPPIDPATHPSSQSDIILAGIQVEANHAIIEYRKETNQVVLCPSSSTARVFVNGNSISASDPVLLAHNDRVLFGLQFWYRFVMPNLYSPHDSENGKRKRRMRGW